MLLGLHIALVLRVGMTPTGRGCIPCHVPIRGQARGILLLPMSLYLRNMKQSVK